ncbi:MAG: chloride channel protein [Deltaproteobacteria bacterium]|nr:chloride channel protein [Deltaproteobacteria bacterium]
MQALRSYLLHVADRLNIRLTGKWLIYGILIGIVAGFGAVVFFYLLKGSQHFFLNSLGGYYPPLPAGESGDGIVSAGLYGPRWILALIPAVGGVVAGIIIYGLAPEAEGHGTDAMIDSFHRGRGVVRGRVPFVKMIASALTIGSGGSAGREGPIAQIGAGFGSYLASLFKLSDRERRIMLLAGAGAGIGGIFKAPLGGALFATEVLYRAPEFEFEAVIPSMIASIVSYSVFGSVMGWDPIFAVPNLQFHHPGELFFYGLLGGVCAIMGIFYVKVFYGFRDKFFKRIPVMNHLKPALGGLMVGVIALFLPQTLEMGYGYVQLAILGEMTIKMMFIIAVAKIFATSFTISSGGSGGVFAPSLTIGAMLGGGFGQVCHHFFPNVIAHPEAFVLVGMGGFFAGVAKVPIAAMIMVCEMTRGYGLLVPLMLVSLISYMLSYRWSIYEKQVSARIKSPAHRGDFIINILEHLTVKDALSKWRKLELVPEDMNFRKILDLVATTTASQFPITNAEGGLAGVLTLDTIRKVIQEEEIFDLLIAKDLGTEAYLTVTPQDNLDSALDKLTKTDQEEIVVVDGTDPNRVLAMLSRRDIIIAYNREIQKKKLQ